MLLIAPHANKAHLASVTDEHMYFRRNLEVTWPVAWCPWRNGLLVCSQESRQLRWINGDDENDGQSWETPDGAIINDLAVVGDRAFLAADDRSYGPVLYHRSLGDIDAQWIDCYPVTLRNRKLLEKLVVDGNRLIAVDNVIIPKYLFVLDDAERSPEAVRVIDLPVHGPKERIKDAVLSGGRLAVLSSTASISGGGEHLYFLDGEYRQSGNLSFFQPMYRASDDADGFPVVQSMMSATALAVGGQRLVVACGHRGVVVVHPDRIAMDIYVAIAERASELRNVASYISVDQFPFHHLSQAASGDRPESVEDATSLGPYGVALTVRLQDQSLEALMLRSDFLQAILD